MTLCESIGAPASILMNMTIIEQLYEDARTGIPGIGPPVAVPRPGTDATPAERDEAARRLVDRYTFLCGATGFLCGLPGYLSLPLTLPINVAGVLVLQLHLGQALALLYGHDPADSEVRRRCITRVTGGWRREDDELVHRAVDKAGERSVRFVGEQSFRLVGRGSRSLPLLGGLVGAVCDARSTADIGAALRTVFSPEG